MKKFFRYIPNILTFLRILFIPFFIICALQGRQVCALIIFIVAALTDTLDGVIARKFNYISDFGKILDPLADKLLVGFALIIFVYIELLPWWLGLLIISREIAMTLYRIYLQKRKIYLSANIFGKIKTTIQMVVIIGALFYEAISYESNVILYIILFLFYLTAFFAWLSFFIYLKQRREHAE